MLGTNKLPRQYLLRDWLVERLRSREARIGPKIFHFGTRMEMRSRAELWRTKLAKVFKPDFPERRRSCPILNRDPAPLPAHVRPPPAGKGVPIPDVAELIGDTEEIVRRHYAKWVPERQARLTKIVQEALGEKPKPHVIRMPARG